MRDAGCSSVMQQSESSVEVSKLFGKIPDLSSRFNRRIDDRHNYLDIIISWMPFATVDVSVASWHPSPLRLLSNLAVVSVS